MSALLLVWRNDLVFPSLFWGEWEVCVDSQLRDCIFSLLSMTGRFATLRRVQLIKPSLQYRCSKLANALSLEAKRQIKNGNISTGKLNAAGEGAV